MVIIDGNVKFTTDFLHLSSKNLKRLQDRKNSWEKGVQNFGEKYK